MSSSPMQNICICINAFALMICILCTIFIIVEIKLLSGETQLPDTVTLIRMVYSIQYICLLTATMVVFMAGLSIHSFIVAVNVIDCWKRRALTTADQILFSIGFSRLLFQVSCLGDVSFTIAPPSIFPVKVIKISMEIILTLCNFSSLWFSALLSIVFCLKISNFHNASCLRLKNFILQKVVYLIFTSVLLSSLYTSVWSWWYHEVINLGMKTRMNVTQINLSFNLEIYYIIGNVVPFILNCIPTIFVLKNLCCHLSQMRGNNNITTHLETYYAAIKCTVSCFITYTLHIIFTLILINYYFVFDLVGFYFIVNVFPSIHSAYLIYITTRLRNQFSRLVYYGKKCFCNGESCGQRLSGQNCSETQDPPQM